MVRLAEPSLERSRRQVPIRPLTLLFYWLLVLLVISIAATLRLWFVLRSDFPLNDGGLFWTMVDDLQRARFRLPSVTSYNHARIPFAYPPFGLYVVALLEACGIPRLELFRFLPVSLTLASIAVFALFSQAVLRSYRKSVAATLVFALLPMSFAWQIMGGGVTRAFGQFFSLLALLFGYQLYTRPSRRALVGLALACALTVLSHPEAAWFVAYSLPLFWAYCSRRRETLAASLLAALGMLLVVSPWLVTILVRHGEAVLRPFQDSGWSVTDGIGRLLLWDVTREPVFPILGMLALLGIPVALLNRQYLLPLWLFVIPVAQPRAFDQRAVIPLALLAGIGLVDLVVPLVQRASVALFAAIRQPRNPVRERLVTGTEPRQLANSPWWLALVLLLLAIQSTIATARGFATLLTGLTPGDREAMTWVATSTPPSARFLVLTGETWFGQDHLAEWFPALTGRTNVGVVQGSEWLGQFSLRIAQATTLQLCSTAGRHCIESWARLTGNSFDYVYIAQSPIWVGEDRVERFGALMAELLHAPDYELVYAGPGAMIFRYEHSASYPGAAA